jgi:cell shape-determining protein MreC|tara:strand:- start:3505 stop:3864 length:360 start_codon:yes stop_codon:yes gene_type:complete
MIFSVLQTTIISIILIFMIHYIYLFLKENLTTPKIRDLVNKPTEQYNKIYKDLQSSPEVTTDMKGELQNYLKSLTKEKNIDNNNINDVKDIKDIKDTNDGKPLEFSFQNEGTNLQYQSL